MTKRTNKPKATSKPKRAKKAVEPPKAATGVRHDRAAVTKAVLKFRDEQNMGWEAIAAKVGCDPGLCRLMHMTAHVKPKDVIKGSPEKVAAAIVVARDERLQSWGLIAARARLAESRVRRIYEEATGVTHQQGYRVLLERTEAKQKAAAATAAKQKAATKAKANAKVVAASKGTARGKKAA